MRLLTKLLLPVVASSMLLTACGSEPKKDTGISKDASSKLMPADKDLASLYKSTCMGCHTSQGSAAPQVGDTTAWAERMAKGMDTVLDGVITGKFGGMPAMGSCSSCSEDELKALITFMSQATAP